MERDLRHGCVGQPEAGGPSGTDAQAAGDEPPATLIEGEGPLGGGNGEDEEAPGQPARNGYAIDFSWTLSMKPAASTASVLANPTGTVSVSRHWEYACPWGVVPSFTPDVPGTYRLQLTGRLVTADPTYPGIQVATSVVDLVVQ